jgi:hypothetical protein
MNGEEQRAQRRRGVGDRQGGDTFGDGPAEQPDDGRGAPAAQQDRGRDPQDGASEVRAVGRGP